MTNEAASLREYLASARIPLRLACRDATGWPRVLSLWYLAEAGSLWCATPAHAHVVRMLERDPRCGFEAAGNEPPYRGVRGEGRARIDRERGHEVLRALVQRYLGSDETSFSRWLLGRRVPEVAIEIEILRLRGWDFTRRMTGGPGTATPTR
jgi:hypothetical protein